MTLPTSILLNTGQSIPVVGLGTWKSEPEKAENAVRIALQTGYRHIDTAAAYQNEESVGKGILSSGVPREDVFLTTKLGNSSHRDVKGAFDLSLQKLGTGYIDLWLMHWPAPMLRGKPDKEWDWLQTWKDMETVYAENRDKVRAIGVSNFSVSFLERLLKEAKVVPAVNQVELHPALPQTALRKYCLEKGIVVTAYSPLGSDNSPLLSDETIKRIAAKHAVNSAQILISFQVHQENTTVIPKSVTPERIISNYQIVQLSEEEVKEISQLYPSISFRACGPLWTGWGSLGMEDVEG